jgi:hypothetical protein
MMISNRAAQLSPLQRSQDGTPLLQRLRVVVFRLAISKPDAYGVLQTTR